LERQLYINQVNLAYRECLANNVAQAESLLEQSPPARRGWEWFYCRRLCHLESLTLGGHSSRPVLPQYSIANSAAFSPDGERVASLFGETISFWDAETGQQIDELRSRDDTLFSIAYSPDGMQIATGGRGTVRLWEVRTGREVRTIRGHTGPVTKV